MVGDCFIITGIINGVIYWLHRDLFKTSRCSANIHSQCIDIAAFGNTGWGGTSKRSRSTGETQRKITGFQISTTTCGIIYRFIHGDYNGGVICSYRNVRNSRGYRIGCPSIIKGTYKPIRTLSCKCQYIGVVVKRNKRMMRSICGRMLVPYGFRDRGSILRNLKYFNISVCTITRICQKHLILINGNHGIPESIRRGMRNLGHFRNRTTIIRYSKGSHLSCAAGSLVRYHIGVCI